MRNYLRNALPESLKGYISDIRQKLKRAIIVNPVGELDPFRSKLTFVMIVGHTFDQRTPNAMMTARLGYCNGFESLGIPYIIVDYQNCKRVLDNIPNPICFLYGYDLNGVSNEVINFLKSYPTGIWVQPWFNNSEEFFKEHLLDKNVWTYRRHIIEKILNLNSLFGFSATVPSGLHFFESWESNGLKMVSLPLACDEKIYCSVDNNITQEFSEVELAFVGGYWDSKGVQLDRYLKPWEKNLTVYGYSEWPFHGYKGSISVSDEPLLYKMAKVCPVINEPTVALMKGQINERIFKVFGSGGCAVVDAVPAYRELFTESELFIPADVDEFNKHINTLLYDMDYNKLTREKGRVAILEKHTYRERALKFMELCGFKLVDNLFVQDSND